MGLSKVNLVIVGNPFFYFFSKTTNQETCLVHRSCFLVKSFCSPLCLQNLFYLKNSTKLRGYDTVNYNPSLKNCNFNLRSY